LGPIIEPDLYRCVCFHQTTPGHPPLTGSTGQGSGEGMPATANYMTAYILPSDHRQGKGIMENM